jgi:hypothetical protein
VDGVQLGGRLPACTGQGQTVSFFRIPASIAAVAGVFEQGVSHSGFWLLASGFWILASGFWILDSGFWLLASGFWLLNSGFWLLASEFWILDSGF